MTAEYSSAQTTEDINDKLEGLAQNIRKVNSKYKTLYESLKHIVEANNAQSDKRQDNPEGSAKGEITYREQKYGSEPRKVISNLNKMEEKILTKKVRGFNKTIKNKGNEEEDTDLNHEEIQRQQISKLINEISVDARETIESKITKELKELANGEESSSNIFKKMNDILEKVIQKPQKTTS